MVLETELKDQYFIQFGEYSYPYNFCQGTDQMVHQLLNEIEGVDQYVILCDRNIRNSHGKELYDSLKSYIKCNMVVCDTGEENKDLSALSKIIEEVLSLRITRKSCIIGLGGGICGNIAGMVAALVFRGIRFVSIPTTVMAILDSVLSLKQAINSRYGKNLIGIFYMPELVIANVGYMFTLPENEVISGLCEVVKNILAITPEKLDDFYQVLSKDSPMTSEDYKKLIHLSITAKSKVMVNDPYEKKEALILEYGHTVGHAIELTAKERISHGEAIGLGMICAAEVAYKMGFLSERDVDLHRSLLVRIGAPILLPEHSSVEEILHIMMFDNKRGYSHTTKNEISMILLKGIGEPLRNMDQSLLNPVPIDLLREVLYFMSGKSR